MITDQIKNAKQYMDISERIGTALEYLSTETLKDLEVGKYQLDGDNLFVLIQEYAGKSVEDGKCEAHKKYIDIQYIIEGRELMGYSPVEGMEIIDPYDEAKDRFFVKWSGDLLAYEKDMFAIFFPQDAHMPGLAAQGCDKIKKAVVKIKI